MTEQTVTLTFTAEEAERLRKALSRESAYTYIRPDSSKGILLKKLEQAGVQPRNYARCPHCRDKCFSEMDLYNHLINVECYPSEDAGDTAYRKWRER
jgi:hypothetical protein